MTEGERFKQLRQALSLTQSEMASKLGIRQTFVSKIEKDESSFSQRVEILLQQNLGVNTDWLRTGHGEMFATKPETALDRLDAAMDELGIDLDVQDLVHAYMDLTDEGKAYFRDFLDKVMIQRAERQGIKLEPVEEPEPKPLTPEERAEQAREALKRKHALEDEELERQLAAQQEMAG